MRIICLLAVLFLSGACSAKGPELIPKTRAQWVAPEEIEKYMGTDSTSPKMRRHRGGVFVVGLSSSTRIAEYLKKNDYALSVESYLCNEPSKEVLMTPFGLYYQGAPVDDPLASDPTQHKAPPYIYDLIILDSAEGGEEVPLSWRGGQKPRRYQPFNLRSYPQDVCLRIVAGGISGGFRDYESAIMRVTQIEIEQAIKKSSTGQ